MIAYLLLNPSPDDTGHLIAVNVDDGLAAFNFFERCELTLANLCEHFFNLDYIDYKSYHLQLNIT